MTPHDLYLEAKRRGLELQVRGSKLSVTPRHRCPPDFTEVLREHKTALIEWLEREPCPGWQAVPPNDLPLNPVQPRPTMAGARLVMDYIMRQIGDKPGQLCEWCLRREAAYWEAYHWADQVCAYRAALDAVCWQLRRSEEMLWELLEGFADAAGSCPNSSETFDPRTQPGEVAGPEIDADGGGAQMPGP